MENARGTTGICDGGQVLSHEDFGMYTKQIHPSDLLVFGGVND